MFRQIRTLMHKEFLAVWRDKKSRFVLVVPPLMQLLIFAFAATLDVENVSMGILNRDSGKQGFELAERFMGAPVFTRVTQLIAAEQVAPFLDNQLGAMVLSIDEQFSRNLDAGKPATVQLLLDGRKSNSAQIIAGYAARIIAQFNDDFAAQAEIPQQNTQLVPWNWFNPNLLYYWFNVPNLSGVLTMLVALLVTALSVARERELGTFDQLLVSPLSPLQILAGKTVAALAVAMVEGTVIILAAVFVFGIPFIGNPLLLYLGLFVFASAIIGIGLFISTLCATQQQAVIGTYTFMSPAILLSGFATPIENMPDWLQIITYANPIRYYLVIARGVMLKGMPWHAVLHYTWPMAVIACITLTTAGWFFRRRLQ
jgi:ABC-2 type transport system permease protein